MVVFWYKTHFTLLLISITGSKRLQNKSIDSLSRSHILGKDHQFKKLYTNVELHLQFVLGDVMSEGKQPNKVILNFSPGGWGVGLFGGKFPPFKHTHTPTKLRESYKNITGG